MTMQRRGHGFARICDLCPSRATWHVKGGGDVCDECAMDTPLDMLITDPAERQMAQIEAAAEAGARIQVPTEGARIQASFPRAVPFVYAEYVVRRSATHEFVVTTI